MNENCYMLISFCPIYLDICDCIVNLSYLCKFYHDQFNEIENILREKQ